jgi:dihydropteroate synthase
MKFIIGKREFDFNYAHTMAILNITPDSFSDGGKYYSKKAAVACAIDMIEAGVDIIDIGGESSRPGAEPVSESEEIERVISVIRQIIKHKPDAVLSIDTTKANVAKSALEEGALIVNDISAGSFEPEILNVIKEFRAAVVLMHMKGNPSNMQQSPFYTDVVSEVYEFLLNQTLEAKKLGIDKIFIDPGIGFGKNADHNFNLLANLDEFSSIGSPVVIGLSRKSFIGNFLDLPVDSRDSATNALNALALSNGARIIRTHNYREGIHTCKLFNKIISI